MVDFWQKKNLTLCGLRIYEKKLELLWEGLSHSASLRLIVIVLKSHSALLRSMVIVLKVVATKTNWRGKNMEYKFKTTSLLPNQKYEFKILLV